jgi:hypothetical protein
MTMFADSADSNKPKYKDSAGNVQAFGGTGDVVASTTATNANAVVIYAGTTGKAIRPIGEIFSGFDMYLDSMSTVKFLKFSGAGFNLSMGANKIYDCRSLVAGDSSASESSISWSGASLDQVTIKGNGNTMLTLNWSAGTATLGTGLDLLIASGKVLKVNSVQVVGAQGAVVADASAVSGTATSGGYGFVDAAEMNSFISGVNSLKDQLNTALARLRTHGLIASS